MPSSRQSPPPENEGIGEVQTSISGISDSFLAVDANGLTGGLSFSIIAQVNGVSAAQLFDVNNFVL